MFDDIHFNTKLHTRSSTYCTHLIVSSLVGTTKLGVAHKSREAIWGFRQKT